MLRSA